MGTGKTYSTKYLLDSNNSSGVAGQVLSTTSTGIDWVDANTVPGTGLWLANGNNIYNSNSGNVGIGTTSPGKKLDVVSTSGTSIVQSLRNPSTSWNQYALTRYGTEGADFRYMDFGYFRGNNNEATRGLVVKSQANATLVTFLDAGNVGIGTTSPDSKLEVDMNDASGNRLGFTGDGSTTGAALWTNWTTGASYLDFRLGGITDTYTKMRITSSGNVGIGETSPTAKLHVVSTVPTCAIFDTTSSSYGAMNIFKAQGVVKGITGFNSNAMYFGGEAGVNTIIQANGQPGIYVKGAAPHNVGIGTTTPVAPLHIVTPAVAGVDLTDISRTANNLVRFTNPQYSTSATMGLLLRVFPDSDARQGAGLLMTGGSDNAASNLSLFVSKDDGSGNNISKSYSALHIAGNTGNVGIGTSFPTGKLEIQRSQVTTQFDRDCFLRLHPTATTNSNGFTNMMFGTSTVNNYGVAVGGKKAGTGDTSSNNNPEFSVRILNDSITGIEVLNINTTGSVKFNAYNGTNNTGSPTHILGTDANGLIVKSTAGSSIGPWLPLAAGSGDPLTGDLYINKSAPALRLNDSGDNVPYELRVDGTTFSIKEVTNSRTLMSMTAGAVITLDSLGSNTVINTTGAMVVPNGKVGIGTTLPDAPLHILKAAGGANIVTALKLDPDDATAGSGVSIDFNASTTNTGASLVGSRIVGARQGGNASGFLALYTSPDASGSVPLERMRINSSGNVGIGTNSPNDKLNIHNSSANANLGIKITRGSQTHGLRLGVNDSHAFLWTDQNQDLVFATNDSQRVTIKAGGNVGIGTTSPVAKLHVEGTGDLVRLVSTNAGSAGAQMDMLQFSASPADDDVMGLINMGGYYSGTSSAYFSSIRTIATDVSARKGALSFLTRSGNDFTEKMHITSSADANKAVVAIGITPSNWYNYTALQVGTGSLQSPSSSTITLGCNYYVDSGVSTTETYITNGSATAYQQGSGTHAWYTAPSGTAGNGVTFTERMRITNTGNVGIGVDDPQAKLEVKGASASPADGNEVISVTNTTGGSKLLLGVAENSYGWIQSAEGSTYRNLLLNPLGGNVGIGVTNPAYKLVVYETGTATSNIAIDVRATGAGTNNYAVWAQGSGASSTNFAFYGAAGKNAFLGNTGIGTDSPTTTLSVQGTSSNGINVIGVGTTATRCYLGLNSANKGYLFITGSSGENPAVITSQGDSYISTNLGVGTTSPGAKLDVKTAAAPFTALKVSNYGTNVNALYAGAIDDTYLYFGSGFYYNSSKFRAPSTTAAITSYNSGVFRVFTNSGLTANTDYTPTERMRITSSGNVGINNLAPNEKLSVRGNIELVGEDVGNCGVRYIKYNCPDEASYNVLGLTTSTANFITKVGINKTSPAVKLDVSDSIAGSGFTNGLARFENTIETSSGGAGVLNIANNYQGGFGTLIKFWYEESSVATINFNSSTNAVVYNTTSDYRLKEDLQQFDGLEIVDQIKTYNYKWKKADARGYGALAHELQEVFPDAVTGEKDGEDMQGVDYSTLVPVLIKSIQELKAEIELLKQQINN